MNTEAWIFLIVYILTVLLVFISRNWLKTRIEQSVRAGFEAKLESLRADLRKNEEEFKSELRSKEGQIAALRDGILTGRAQRQALIDKRRLEAIDRLWNAFLALAPFTMVSKMMASINFDVAAKEVHRHPNMQQFFKTISGGDQTESREDG